MSTKKSLKTINALVFEKKIFKLIKAYLRGLRNPNGYWKPGGPVKLKQVPYPSLISEDWLVIQTKYCGICGSDMTELKLKGSLDNPLQTFISFPQIMGHEAVGVVKQIGSRITRFKIGERIVISPWFPCAPRGIEPQCVRCMDGDFTHCKNFKRGHLPQGMHLGVTRGYGGFAPYIAVHESQCFLIPKNVSFEQAVLADPFSVAFHSILILNPGPEDTILIYGLGIIGLLAILCLKSIFHIKNVLAVGRYQFQEEMAIKLGAKHVFMNSGEDLINEIASYMNLELYTPEKGLKWSMDGFDGIIDTIASAETFEIGIRILTTQGRLVFLGVNKPKRFENSLHYFKELEIIGSNAFSKEFFEGKKTHAFNLFLDFLSSNIIDTAPFITHKFPLDQYRKAFNVLSNKEYFKAIKVLFEFNFESNCE